MGIFERLLGGGHHRRQSGMHHDRYDNAPQRNQDVSWGTRSQSAATPSSNCGACGMANNAGARFCQQCGVSLVLLKCAGCNADMVAGMKFCGKCGKER